MAVARLLKSTSRGVTIVVLLAISLSRLFGGSAGTPPVGVQILCSADFTDNFHAVPLLGPSHWSDDVSIVRDCTDDFASDPRYDVILEIVLDVAEGGAEPDAEWFNADPVSGHSRFLVEITSGPLIGERFPILSGFGRQILVGAAHSVSPADLQGVSVSIRRILSLGAVFGMDGSALGFADRDLGAGPLSAGDAVLLPSINQSARGAFSGLAATIQGGGWVDASGLDASGMPILPGQLVIVRKVGSGGSEIYPVGEPVLLPTRFTAPVLASESETVDLLLGNPQPRPLFLDPNGSWESVLEPVSDRDADRDELLLYRNPIGLDPEEDAALFRLDTGGGVVWSDPFSDYLSESAPAAIDSGSGFLLRLRGPHPGGVFTITAP